MFIHSNPSHKASNPSALGCEPTIVSSIVIVHSKRNKQLSFCEVACIRGALEGAYYRGDHFDLLEKRVFLFSIFLLFYFSI